MVGTGSLGNDNLRSRVGRRRQSRANGLEGKPECVSSRLEGGRRFGAVGSVVGMLEGLNVACGLELLLTTGEQLDERIFWTAEPARAAVLLEGGPWCSSGTAAAWWQAGASLHADCLWEEEVLAAPGLR